MRRLSRRLWSWIVQARFREVNQWLQTIEAVKKRRVTRTTGPEKTLPNFARKSQRPDVAKVRTVVAKYRSVSAPRMSEPNIGHARRRDHRRSVGSQIWSSKSPKADDWRLGKVPFPVRS